MNKFDERAASVREMMIREGLDAYIINGTDPHMSEYTCPRWRTRAFMTGFLGSAGTVIITRDAAYLWVDSRYNIQAAAEIKGTSYILMKQDDPGVPTATEWLAANFNGKGKVGISADTLMISAKQGYEKLGIEIVPTGDYLNEIWTDRPPVPENAVERLSDEVCGATPHEKMERIRAAFRAKGCGATLVSSLDDIAWILNLRGSDIAYNPVFLSYLLITTRKAILFTSKNRFTPELLESESKDYLVLPYEDLERCIAPRTEGIENIYIDPDKTNCLAFAALGGKKLVFGRDFSTDFKAAKNAAELEGMRRAHLLDGVALVNFFAKLKGGMYNEYELGEALNAERARSREYVGPGFGPIAGFAEHGAMCHYSAAKEGSKKVEGNGLLVLDTGGAYTAGLTDVTRTILFGEATEEQKRDYTLVLKGNINLSAQKFPEGTNGYQLDSIARMHLWNSGLTFYHGTGHGVGFRLCVHEGPQSISPRVTSFAPLVPGMVTSDEPGVYKEGRHGIRIENLVVTVPWKETEFGKFLGFEVLTVCPYERNLIEPKLLTHSEIDLINSYHEWVWNELKDLVDRDAVEWLREKTAPITK